jgi:hypothetical protein
MRMIEFILKYVFSYHLEGLQSIHGRDSNLRPLRYEAGVLINKHLYAISCLLIRIKRYENGSVPKHMVL